MIPVLSSSVVRAPFDERVNDRAFPLVDYENGGPTLGFGSDDVSYQWEAISDGTSIMVGRTGVTPVVVETDTGITEISLAFDQTMRPHVAYIAGGVAKFRWWNSLASAYETMVLTAARTPRCCTDEKRAEFSAARDVVLTYMLGSSLFVRVQRERFQTAHELVPALPPGVVLTESTSIISLGRNTANRLQWRLA